MLTLALGISSVIFLSPALLISLTKEPKHANGRLYVVAILGLIFLLSYLSAEGLWPIAIITVCHLILYYFGMSGIIAYRRTQAILPSIINIFVTSFMILTWIVMLTTIDLNQSQLVKSLVLAEGIMTAMIILISTLPIISLFNTVIFLSRAWPFISWSLIILICYFAEAWIGIGIYSVFLIVTLSSSLYNKSFKK